MERDFREVVQSWLDGNFDEATKAQIRELQANDPVGLEDAFYRNLEFGKVAFAVSWELVQTV